ncbi:Mannosylglucosylglycerate synthase [Planctomycetaceae bacterium]|nr:Mannosylglucosylglycerate synthase [Planctomycetaceae bacterium]
MNIALLHYSSPPIVGGVENVLAQQARLMQQAGHRVRILAARGAAQPGIDFVPLPLIDSRHPRVLAVKAELDQGRVPADFEPLVDEIERTLRTALVDVDILIPHNVCSLNKNLALTAAIQRLTQQSDRPRVILWHHDLAWTTPRYRAELHDGYPWDLLRTDWGARHVVVSDLRQRELADLLHIPLDSITVVPNGVDVAAFYKLEATTRNLIERLDLLSAAPILLLPVRVTPRKNIELAVRVLAELRRDFPDAVLIITGPLGPHNAANVDYFTQLKRLRAELDLSGAVHFLAELIEGYLPDEVIADFYRLSDALILPSREEGFGIPVIEAAFSHLPIFCADIPPLRALGCDDVTYFSPDDDPGAIAALLTDHFRCAGVSRWAMRARRAFSWARVYADHIAPLLLEGGSP